MVVFAFAGFHFSIHVLRFGHFSHGLLGPVGGRPIRRAQGRQKLNFIVRFRWRRGGAGTGSSRPPSGTSGIGRCQGRARRHGLAATRANSTGLKMKTHTRNESMHTHDYINKLQQCTRRTLEGETPSWMRKQSHGREICWGERRRCPGATNHWEAHGCDRPGWPGLNFQPRGRAPWLQNTRAL